MGQGKGLTMQFAWDALTFGSFVIGIGKCKLRIRPVLETLAECRLSFIAFSSANVVVMVVVAAPHLASVQCEMFVQ